MRQILCIIFVLIFVACSSDKSQDSTKPAVSSIPSGIAGTVVKDDCNKCSLEIKPSIASRDSMLTLHAQGFYLAAAKVDWMVNGNTVVNSNPQVFKTSEVKKGNAVQASAVIKGVKIMSNEVQIKNALPEITMIKIIPENNTLSIETEGGDVDGDPVKFFYEWTKNGQPAGTGKKIDSILKRGDKVVVKVTPFDGEDYGRKAVVEKEIDNTPPVIVEHKDYSYVGGVFTYKVKAEDPDGDALAYTLKTAPQGMIIDKASGLITWKTPLGFIGNGSFTVVVDDGHGGETSQQLTFKITE